MSRTLIIAVRIFDLLGFPETSDGVEEDIKEEVYHFFESVLNIDFARQIEFQRIHRIGKKSNRKVGSVYRAFLTLQG